MNWSEPVLQDLSVVLRAPQAVLSGRSGDMDGSGQGLLSRDTRHLRTLVAEIDGRRLVPVGLSEDGDTARYEGVDPATNYLPMDGPSLHLTRRRTITDDGFSETWTVSNDGLHSSSSELTMRASSDLAELNVVRSGLEDAPVAARETNGCWRWDRGIRWTELVVDVAPTTTGAVDGETLLKWRVDLAPRAQFEIRIEVAVDGHDEAPLVLKSAAPVFTRGGIASATDASRLLRRSAQDLDGLLLTDSKHPLDVFPAAGAPWYFTLFGRDSIWTALLLSDAAPGFGRGVVNALERYQGVTLDRHSEEQPGRFPHEVRSAPVRVYGVLDLPPVYYGNIDATALWLLLAHRIWTDDGGGPVDPDRARSIESALSWIVDYGDRDGDYLVEYAGSDDRGLAHQAWKDSPTGITHADGRPVTRPIAACEVQGYTYAGVLAGAAMLDAAELPSERWRTWASLLRERFRDVFWTSDSHGRHPALALDGEKRVVAGAASNMAHLLGTGILRPSETAAVVERLRSADLDSGYGLRTLSSEVTAFSPLSYHRGSVWPHDTAIAIRGLLAEGYADDARRLAVGLVAASTWFDGRLPELYGGDPREVGRPLTSYPTACFPQAWSAAAGILAAGVAAGGAE